MYNAPDEKGWSPLLSIVLFIAFVMPLLLIWYSIEQDKLANNVRFCTTVTLDDLEQYKNEEYSFFIVQELELSDIEDNVVQFNPYSMYGIHVCWDD